MKQVLDVKSIVDSICSDDQTNIMLSFPIYAENSFDVESGSMTNILSSTAVYNIPLSHFVSFEGTKTNISIYTTSGVLHPYTHGQIAVKVGNSSLQNHTMPKNWELGTLLIKKYTWYS